MFDAPDFGHARQEDEQTALIPRQRAADNLRDSVIEMTGEGFIKIPGLDWKHSPFAGDDRCAAQELTDRSAIQCGRHDEQAQVRTKEPL